jgi:hypothetical protein
MMIIMSYVIYNNSITLKLDVLLSVNFAFERRLSDASVPN